MSWYDNPFVSPLGYGYKKLFGDPANAQKSGLDQASQASRQLGLEQRGYYENATRGALGAFGGAQQQFQNAYGPGGGLSQPGQAEQFYADTLAGKNDFGFQRQAELGGKAISDKFAAAGGLNSGAALQAQENLQADLRAKQQQMMAGLAGQAQGAQFQREQGGIQSGLGLGSAEAGVGLQGAGMAGGAYERGAVSGIDAKLQQSGIDAQTAQRFQQFLLGLGQAGAGLAGGK